MVWRFSMIPHETSFEWVYFPPFFFTVLIGFACALVTAQLLNRVGLYRLFWNPGLSFVAMWVLFTSLVGLFLLPP